jgi:prepilin-type N-terminal cleavage/methylation domain-containing protein
MMRLHRRTQRGLTLIEICVAMVVLATAVMGMAATMMTGMAANRQYQMNTMVLARAQAYVELLNNLQFGDGDDEVLAAPDSPDDALAELFDPEVEVGGNPPSLYSLARSIKELPNEVLDLGSVDGFPSAGIPGDFLIRVSNNVQSTLEFPAAVDPDGDGVPDGAAALLLGSFIEQEAGEGCFEDDDDSDQSMELFGFEVFYRPNFPANAQPRLVLRGLRAQDP